MTLHGRRAVVTGAATGIGQALAVALAREGADVVTIDLAETDETAALVAAHGRLLHALQGDTGDRATVDRLARARRRASRRHRHLGEQRGEADGEAGRGDLR